MKGKKKCFLNRYIKPGGSILYHMNKLKVQQQQLEDARSLCRLNILQNVALYRTNMPPSIAS